MEVNDGVLKMFTESSSSIFNWKRLIGVFGLPVAVGAIAYYFLSKQKDVKYENTLMRSDFRHVAIAVPADKVGAVIGRGGCVIREIEQSSGARVRMQSNAPSTDENPLDEEQNFVSIRGSDESVLAAEIAVRKILAQTPSVLTEYLYVPKTSLGLIIGKGGANIREISNISGAKLHVNNSGDEMELVIIKGRPAAIESAKACLKEKVHLDKELRERREKENLPASPDSTAHNEDEINISQQNGLHSGEPLCLNDVL